VALLNDLVLDTKVRKGLHKGARSKDLI